MSIPPVKLTLFGGQKRRSNYQLTALGKTKAEQINITGTKGEVVMALENIGPCTISELANEIKISSAQAKQVMRVLIRDGWASKVSAEE